MLICWLDRNCGVYFAMGGTRLSWWGMVEMLEEIGVEFHYNSPVEHIEVDDNRVAKAVQTADGQRFEADLIVCNADPSMIYKHAIDKKHRRMHRDGRIDRKRQSMSLFVAYFGTKKTYEEIAHHTIILGPRYKGLLNDIFRKKVLADDFSLYLHAPTRSDASVAPPGHEGFYVLSPVPNERSGIDWEAQHEEYLDRILTKLDERYLPGLKENLVTKFAVDPRYFTEKMRSTDGAAFGIEPVLTQSAYFRYHNRSDDIGGLYFVGANTHPGAGVPGVLCSAKVLEHVLPELPASSQVPVPHAIMRQAAE